MKRINKEQIKRKPWFKSAKAFLDRHCVIKWIISRPFTQIRFDRLSGVGG